MPKTQSALLEAMAERQVTVDGVTRALPEPFLVIATENPIEQEGTFPLPEAQLDRFFLRTALGYPTRTRRSRSSSRSGTAIRSRRSSRVVDARRRARAAGRGRGRLRRRARLGAGSSSSSARRARSRASRSARRCAAASRSSAPRARGRCCTAATTSCPRTSSGSSCPCSATGCCSRASFLAETRALGRDGALADASGERCLELAPPPGARTGEARRRCAVAARERAAVSARPAPAARRAAVRRPAEPPPRPRQRRDRLAAVRARRPGLDDRLVRVARGSRRRPARRVHRPRALRRRGAARRRASATAGRRWRSTPSRCRGSRSRGVAECGRRSSRARSPRAALASLDFGEAEGRRTGCRPDAATGRGSCRRDRRPRASTRPRTPSRAALAFLGAHAQRPAARARSSSSSPTSSSRRRPTTWLDAVGAGWDVVPVVVQDPVWEQSFPTSAASSSRSTAERRRRRRSRPAERREAARRREETDERRRGLLQAARARPRPGARLVARASRRPLRVPDLGRPAPVHAGARVRALRLGARRRRSHCSRAARPAAPRPRRRPDGRGPPAGPSRRRAPLRRARPGPARRARRQARPRSRPRSASPDFLPTGSSRGRALREDFSHFTRLRREASLSASRTCACRAGSRASSAGRRGLASVGPTASATRVIYVDARRARRAGRQDLAGARGDLASQPEALEIPSDALIGPSGQFRFNAGAARARPSARRRGSAVSRSSSSRCAPGAARTLLLLEARSRRPAPPPGESVAAGAALRPSSACGPEHVKEHARPSRCSPSSSRHGRGGPRARARVAATPPPAAETTRLVAARREADGASV